MTYVFHHFISFLVTPWVFHGGWLVAVGTLWYLSSVWAISFCFLLLRRVVAVAILWGFHPYWPFHFVSGHSVVWMTYYSRTLLWFWSLSPAGPFHFISCHSIRLMTCCSRYIVRSFPAWVILVRFLSLHWVDDLLQRYIYCEFFSLYGSFHFCFLSLRWVDDLLQRYIMRSFPALFISFCFLSLRWVDDLLQ